MTFYQAEIVNPHPKEIEPMSRIAAARISFVACLSLSPLAAGPALAGNASGTIGRGATTLKVADAVAWKTSATSARSR